MTETVAPYRWIAPQSRGLRPSETLSMNEESLTSKVAPLPSWAMLMLGLQYAVFPSNRLPEP